MRLKFQGSVTVRRGRNAGITDGLDTEGRVFKNLKTKNKRDFWNKKTHKIN